LDGYVSIHVLVRQLLNQCFKMSTKLPPLHPRLNPKASLFLPSGFLFFFSCSLPGWARRRRSPLPTPDPPYWMRSLWVAHWEDPTY
jgi:hypothetical protein